MVCSREATLCSRPASRAWHNQFHVSMLRHSGLVLRHCLALNLGYAVSALDLGYAVSGLC